MNVNRIFDEYSGEDYLCNKTRPISTWICADCNNVFDALFDWDNGLVCSCCGSLKEPYEEP